MSPEGRLLMSPAPGPPPPPRRAGSWRRQHSAGDGPEGRRLRAGVQRHRADTVSAASGVIEHKPERVAMVRMGLDGVADRGVAAPTLVLWAEASGHDQPSTVKNPSRRRYMFEKSHAFEVCRSRPQTHTAAGCFPFGPGDAWRDRWAIRGQDQPLRHGEVWLGPAWWCAISAHFKGLHCRAVARASAGSQ